MPGQRRLRGAFLSLVVAAGLALFAPAGAQQQSVDTYGPVRQADTLWELALRFRRDANVTAQQAMIAILRANPEAFREGNINALRTGVTLRVPSAAEMTAITQAEAVAEFNRHEQAWRNRRRTGTAAPGPGSSAPAQPARAPSPTAAGEQATLESQLGEVRAKVTELNERLAERDDAIEELLVQLAAVRRELRQAQGDAPAAPGRRADAEGEPESEAAARATWLPVSPLVLGSSLIVLLVLIVVVTLIRQRGGREEPYAEEDGDEEEELYELEPDEEAEEVLHDARAGDRGHDEEKAEPGRIAARPTSVAAAAAVDVAREFDSDQEDEDPPEHDLPIGMDLEGEEDWDEGSDEGEGTDDLSAPARADGPPRFGRHVEVGELDDLEFDSGSGRATLADRSEDLDDDQSPADGEPGRSGGGRRR